MSRPGDRHRPAKIGAPFDREPADGMAKLRALLADVAAPGPLRPRPVGLPRDLHEALQAWASRRCVG